MDPIPSPLTLESVIFYHQDRPIVGCLIPPHIEWVEAIVEGRGRVPDGGRWREVGPGDLIWQSPGDTTIGSPDCEQRFHTFAARFTVARAGGMGVRRFSKWTDIGGIKELIRETCRFQWDPLFDRNALKDYLYAKLLFQVRLYERSLAAEHYPEPVALAVRRIERGYAGALPLGALARECGWSAAHLHAEFLKHVKTTPHQFLIQKRLAAAKERLTTTAEPVKKIAVECGFANMAAFGHAFKVRTGQTPHQFRKAHGRAA